MSDEVKLRIALVGCGGLGKGHAREITQMPGVELVSVNDVSLAAAEALAATLEPKPAAYGDYKEMFSREKLDGVIIVTPNFTHKEITVAAASAGIHVFCEKPMALTLSECDEMIAATERAGVTLMVGYVRRFEPTYVKMKEVIDEGVLGDIRFAFALRLGKGAPGGAGGWQNKRHLYGGMFSQFIHELDQLIWYAGDVASVEATFTFGNDPSNDVEEVASLNLHFASGASGSLISSRIHPISSYEMSVAGTQGSARFTVPTGPLFVQSRQEKQPTIIELPKANAKQGEFQHFFDCIRRGERPGPDGIVGRHGVAVSLAADEAYRSGRRVEVSR